jgi:catechol 2,3-dioxygenase-like lactoylglutathione lyase family enzyme
MLKDANVMATVGVKNLAAARAFYVDKLGLEPEAASEPGVMSLRSGNATLLVYESQYAGTNRATAATWPVGDELEAIVGTLKERGVPFEHYDMPETTRRGDIHVSGGTQVAWCKDPDGNILALVNG